MNKGRSFQKKDFFRSACTHFLVGKCGSLTDVNGRKYASLDGIFVWEMNCILPMLPEKGICCMLDGTIGRSQFQLNKGQSLGSWKVNIYLSEVQSEGFWKFPNGRLTPLQLWVGDTGFSRYLLLKYFRWETGITFRFYFSAIKAREKKAGKSGKCIFSKRLFPSSIIPYTGNEREWGAVVQSVRFPNK